MPADPSQKYLIRDTQGNVYGPADVPLLREWVGQGRIVAGMYIAERETRQWIEASSHPAVADLLQPQSQPRPASPPSLPTKPATPATPKPVQPWPASPAEIELRPTPVRPAPAMMPAPTRPMHLPYQSASTSSRQNVCGLIGFIASLFGAATLIFTCTPCVCLVMPVSALCEVTAIVLGAIGLYQIRERPEAYTGRGLAMASLIMGVVVLILYVIGLVVFFVVQSMH